MKAAEHLREAIDFGCTREDHDHVGAHRAEVLEEVAAWLGKKDREYRGWNSRETPAEALERMADKIRRGAVRPPLPVREPQPQPQDPNHELLGHDYAEPRDLPAPADLPESLR